MVISLWSGIVSFLSPTTVIIALAHSRCLMSGRAMAEREMKGNEGFGGGVLEIPSGLCLKMPVIPNATHLWKL